MDRVWRRQAVLLPLAAVVAVAGGVVWSRVVADDGDDVVDITPGEYADPASTNAENEGAVFPSFDLTGADGASVSLAPGDRPLVVNLWYSTCPPCSRELAAFGAVAADLGDDVRFVGVNPLDDADTMVEYAADRGVDYELLMDPDEFVGAEFGILQYPATFFVSTDGEVVAQTGVLSEGDLREHIAGAHSVMLALDNDALSRAFALGMMASVNPCGFVLLPTYLLYFLGVEASGTSTDQRASVRRALIVGTSVSTGFITVFLAIGALTEFVDRWVLRNSKYATGVIGLVFVALGAAMLAGYRPRFAMPHLDAGGRARSVTSMAVYGVAYAVASLGCTMPLFLPAVFGSGRREGIATGVSSAVLYALGMSLVVIALTVSLALANQALLRVLRSAMRYVDLLGAAFLLLSGLYLLYYFVVVDVRGDRSSITDSLTDWQESVSSRLSDHWQVAALVLAAVVSAAIVFVTRRNGARVAPAPPETG